MTFTIAYAFHNKEGKVKRIIDGLKENITNCNYLFILDGCTDNTEKELIENTSNLSNVKILHEPDIFELYSNNKIMHTFETDCVIIFQDDMILQDKNLIEYLEKIYLFPKVGVVGFRDGFSYNYSYMFSSKFSESGGTILENGQYQNVKMINRGPFAVSKELINTVGYLSTDYNKAGSYSEMDYCLKAESNGFFNYVVGLNIIHDRHQNTQFFQMDNDNRNIFIKKWGNIA